jgi:cysteine desulfurase
VHEEEVLFTSGGTEANNLALRGVLAARGNGSGLVTGAIEHSSVLETARALRSLGHPVRELGVDRAGRLDEGELARSLADESVALVSLHAANNEIGVLWDLQRIAATLDSTATGRERPLLHTDAVQALGRIPLELSASGADLASFSVHKVGGPVGTGILWKRRGVQLVPLLTGGDHEGGLRAGTEDVAGIASAALAVELAVAEQERFAAHARELVLWMWSELRASVRGVRLLGPALDARERLPNTLAFSVPGEDGKVLVTRLDLEGIAIGAGSACASGSLEPSHVLVALGCDEDEARAGLRVSLGRDTTREDCRLALEVFRKRLGASHAS